MVAFLTGVVAITQRTNDRQLTFLGYGVVVVSAVGLFFDVLNPLYLGTEATVIGLLSFAAVLFGIRARLDDTNRLVSGRVATVAFGSVAALAAVLLLVDAATGGVAYELQSENQVEITNPWGQVSVASVVVTDPTAAIDLRSEPT